MNHSQVLIFFCLIFGLAASQREEQSGESSERYRARGPFGFEASEEKRVSKGSEENNVERHGSVGRQSGEEKQFSMSERSRRAVSHGHHGEEEEEEAHVQHEHGLSEGKDESVASFGFQGRKERQQKHQQQKQQMPQLGEKTRKAIGQQKKVHVFYEKAIEYFVKSPLTQQQRQCFERNLKTGFSVDFVVDLAPSPSFDEMDKLSSDSPIALLLEQSYKNPTDAYFSAIEFFIDAVTIDMKPELTHSIIYDQGRKFYIRGRAVDQCEAIERLISGGDFMDAKRNLKTLWPVCTKEAFSKLEPIVKNNLGHLTKLALWNRDNGLPTVLASERRSKPGLIFVITDGASGTKITELTDDLSRTIVFDIGNHRFIDRLSWDEVRRIVGTYTLTAPQQLALMLETARNMACRLLEQSTQQQQQQNVM